MVDITDKKYHSYHITRRFLFAVDRIVGNRTNGKTSYKEVCEVIGMASSNLKRLRDATTDHFVTIEAIGRLCTHYKISPSYIILEIGNLYADLEIFAAYESLEKRMIIVEEVIKQIELSIKPKVVFTLT
jgi:DNA-binding Xre family transcriptional regulator